MIWGNTFTISHGLNVASIGRDPTVCGVLRALQGWSQTEAYIPHSFVQILTTLGLITPILQLSITMMKHTDGTSAIKRSNLILCLSPPGIVPNLFSTQLKKSFSRAKCNDLPYSSSSFSFWYLDKTLYKNLTSSTFPPLIVPIIGNTAITSTAKYEVFPKTSLFLHLPQPPTHLCLPLKSFWKMNILSSLALTFRMIEIIFSWQLKAHRNTDNRLCLPWCRLIAQASVEDWKKGTATGFYRP